VTGIPRIAQFGQHAGDKSRQLDAHLADILDDRQAVVGDKEESGGGMVNMQAIFSHSLHFERFAQDVCASIDGRRGALKAVLEL
jgi:hypothetical protein